MTITLENQNTINNILHIETPFNVNQIYTCRKGACQKIAYVSDSGINAKGKKERAPYSYSITTSYMYEMSRTNGNSMFPGDVRYIIDYSFEVNQWWGNATVRRGDPIELFVRPRNGLIYYFYNGMI